MKPGTTRFAILTWFVAAAATAGTTGFSLTVEEAGLPPANQWLSPGAYPLGGFKAPVGFVDVFSANTVKILSPDPVGGQPPCDPTTFKAIQMDATDFVAEMHLRFPMTARGNMIVFDKLQLGAERTDVRGLRAGVFSGDTRTPEIDLEFREDGYIYVFDARVPTPNGDLRYQNVYANSCATGVDNHITLEMFHNLVGGTVMVQVTTHGTDGATFQLGPFPMGAKVKAEGIGGMYLYAPPLSGRYHVDGMVCTGNAIQALPTGSGNNATPRRRF